MSKTFVIDHPEQENRYLVHACLEGPEAGVYYRGQGEILMGKTFTEIILPSYTRNFYDFTINITAIISDTSILNMYGVTPVVNGKFKVITNNMNGGKFYYTVFGKREDVRVEPLKRHVTVNGEGPYKYIDT